MTVKHGLLAILTLGPAYGLQLRDELVSRAPHRSGINVGQVYGTLDRLQKSGRVVSAGVTHDNLPLYALTPAGRDDASAWLSAPALTDVLDWTEMLDQVLVCSSLDGAPLPELIAGYRVLWRSHAEALQDDGTIQSDLAARAVADTARAACDWLDAADRTFAEAPPSFGLSRLRPRRGRRPTLAV